MRASRSAQRLDLGRESLPRAFAPKDGHAVETDVPFARILQREGALIAPDGRLSTLPINEHPSPGI
ncbi:MAG: hypothetical protein ACLQVX_03745 [Limisphaerales bacterium]